MQQQPGEEVGLDVALLALHAETLRTPGRVLIISVASECESGHRGHSDPPPAAMARLRAQTAPRWPPLCVGGARTRGGGSKLAVSGQRPSLGDLALHLDMRGALGRDHGVMAAKPTRAHTSSSQLRAGVEDRFWSLSSRDFQTEALDKKLIDTGRALRR